MILAFQEFLVLGFGGKSVAAREARRRCACARVEGRLAGWQVAKSLARPEMAKRAPSALLVGESEGRGSGIRTSEYVGASSSCSAPAAAAGTAHPLAWDPADESHDFWQHAPKRRAAEIRDEVMCVAVGRVPMCRHPLGRAKEDILVSRDFES